MVKADRAAWKASYFERLERLFSQYSKVLIVGVDNVGSKQMQDVRMGLRGHAEILMGKNTMIRRCLLNTENEDYASVLPYVKGNIGFVFTDGDLVEIRDMLSSNKRAAPARVGAIAPVPVVIPAGNTGMGPEKTSFFQALNIPTKITRGTIEIINDVNLLSVGDKVGASEAALLNMLGQSPFEYGVEVKMIYENGAVFSPKVLDITEADLRAKFLAGVRNVAAVSMVLGRPNPTSVPHMIVNGYKNVLSIALATDITFPLAEKAKAYLADPSAFAVAVPVAAAGGDAGGAAEQKAPEPEEEEEEEDMDFDLFD